MTLSLAVERREEVNLSRLHSVTCAVASLHFHSLQTRSSSYATRPSERNILSATRAFVFHVMTDECNRPWQQNNAMSKQKIQLRVTMGWLK